MHFFLYFLLLSDFQTIKTHTSKFTVLTFISLLFTSHISSAGDEIREFSVFDKGIIHFDSVGDKQVTPAIMSMVEDNKGFIWLGTQTGLYKYDGSKLKRFVSKPGQVNSINDNYIYRLWLEPSGKIWIGSLNKGVSIFDPLSEKAYDLGEIAPMFNEVSEIFDIAGDDEGNVFIASKDGLSWLNQGSSIAQQFKSIEGCFENDLSIRDLVVGQGNSLWVIQDSKICLVNYDLSTQAFKGVLYNIQLDGPLTQALLDSEHLWVGSQKGGIAKLSISTGEVLKVNSSTSSDIDVENIWTVTMRHFSEQYIWIGTHLDGLLVVDKESLEVVNQYKNQVLNPYSIGINTVSALMQDSSGLFWVGTWGAGLYKHNALNEYAKYLYHDPSLKNGLSKPDVLRAIQRRNGEVWFLFISGGIDVFDPKSGNISELSINHAIDSSVIIHVEELPNGELWLASQTHLYHLSSNLKVLASYNLPVKNTVIRKIKFDGVGDILVGTGKGLLVFNIQSGSHRWVIEVENTRTPLTSIIDSIAVDEWGRAWLGTGRGLFVYEPNTFLLTKPSGEYESLLSGNIQKVFIDDSNRLWVFNHSLESLLMKNLSTPNAPFNNVNVLISQHNPHLVDYFHTGSSVGVDLQGRVWSGNVVIDPLTWKTYLKNEQRHVFMSNGDLITREGVLLQCGPNGVSLIDTNKWQAWQYKPNVVLSKVLINHHLTQENLEYITLTHDNKSVRFEFIALDYLLPKNIGYAYRLDGYDEEWIETNETHVTYTNLAPGEYTFQVKSTNSHRVWSSETASSSLVKHPAWYQTIWFYFILSFLITLIFFFISQFRMKKVNKQKAILQYEINSRTKEIVELGAAGREIASSLDLEHVLNALYERVSKLLDSYVFLVAIVNPKRNTLDIISLYEDGKRLDDTHLCLDDIQRAGPWCVKHGKEILAHTQGELKHSLQSTAKPVMGNATESIIYLPLTVSGKVIGCLSVQSLKPNAYSENTLNMLRTISAYAAIAIDNANAHTNLLSTQEKLIESEKLASLSYLVAGIAHEINTPVGVALTTVSTLGESASDVKLKLDQNQIRKSDIESFLAMSMEADMLLQSSLNRCSELIQDFKKISAEQLEVNHRHLFFKTHLVEVMETYNARLHEQDIKYSVLGDDPEMNVDCNVINQIISNLISNSLTHAFRESKTSLPQDKWIQIEVVETAHSIRFMFSDNGCGISQREKELLLIPFYTTQRGGESLGLGLNVVYNLITSSLKGELNIESKEGEGAKFTITLPK